LDVAKRFSLGDDDDYRSFRVKKLHNEIEEEVEVLDHKFHDSWDERRRLIWAFLENTKKDRLE
jgi:hypothetical protein